MRNRLRLWAAALVLCAAVAPCGAAEPAGLSGSVPGGVLRATLPNGLRIVVIPDRLAPVVTTEMNYLAGSNDAPEGFPGTAHALEHMMFRGSEGLDRDQLAEIGALLGGVYNADTTETVTQYIYTVPADDLSVALRIEALRMHGLTLSQADWEQERGAIDQEVSRDLSSPIYNYLTQAQAILFQGTPYQHDALGTRPSFEKTDAALIRRFYETWYAPNNAILVIAGDVQPDDALAKAKAAFGDLPSRPVPAHAPFAVQPVQPETLKLDTNFPVGLVTIAYRMPGLKQSDFAAADILADVLSSERGALYGLVPAGKALMAQFNYQAKPDVGFGLAYAAFPSAEDPAPVLADVRRVIAEAAQNGVSPELVAAAKRQELAQIAFDANSIQGLAGNWSRALAFQNAESPEDLARAYDAVTVADVNRLARVLLDPDHAVTAILTPRESGRPIAGSGFGGTESFASTPDHPVTLPDWASTALAILHLPDLGEPPDISVLPNGLRLIVQPEHVSHTVSVYGRVREVPEMQEPPGKEGVASVTSNLFEYGTATRDRLAFREAVDDIAARVDTGPNFSLRVLTPDFEPGMKLLAENQLHPAFPDKAFEVVRSQFARSVAGLLRSPSYLFQQAVKRAIMPAGDPTLREPTPESVMALQPADIKAYYDASFRPDLTTIIVLGDVTAEQARRVVTETFGGWHGEGPTPAIELPPVGPNQPSQARVPDSSTVQDSVYLAETVELPVASPDRYPLMLGNVILGSGFSSRLFRDLRVKSGYVYSVSSQLDWSRTRGNYAVAFGADGENVDKARQLVVRDIKDMQTNPVSEGDLNRAKSEQLRRIPMQRDSIGGIAGQYLRLSDLGLPFDDEQALAAHYLNITAADIQHAFATWLRPGDFAEVVRGP
nr:pitrilysin family protein [uncultured Rhodopila sp.]